MMASFLLLAKVIPNASKVEGDPISVKADDDTVTTASGTWHWSAEEDINRWLAEGHAAGDFPDLFYVLDIPGLDIAEAKRCLQSHKRPAIVGDLEFDAQDIPDRMVKLGPSRWNFDIESKFPPQAKADIRANRRANLGNVRATLNAVITDRSTISDDWLTDTPVDPQPPGS